MRHLEALLATPGSRLGQVLRYGLHGLRALLAEARRAEPGDPGAVPCQALLDELDALLVGRQPSMVGHAKPQAAQSQGFPSPPALQSAVDGAPVAGVAAALPALVAPVEPPVLEAVPAPAPGPAGGGARLGRLREALLADPALPARVGALAPPADSDKDLWDYAQRLFLRLPGAQARAWRQKAQELARAAGAEEDPSPENCEVLPLPREEVIYPGLKGSVRARGLRTAPLAPGRAELADRPPEGDLALLVGAVAVCLHFIDRDPTLHHALKAVQSFGVNPLGERDRQRFTAALERRLRQALDQEAAPPGDFLRSRLDLDEAIHSLVYRPPADMEASWWGLLHQELRRALVRAVERVRQAGVAAQVKQLSGLYADLRDLSTHDLEVDGPGPPGHVAACLRPYARVEGEVLPGRVLYFPAKVLV